MTYANRPELTEQIRRLRDDEGKSWKEIAKATGVVEDTAKRWYSVPYAEHRKAKNAASKRIREQAKERRAEAHKSPAGFKLDPTMTSDAVAMAERLKREIPPDTRDLTGRLLGDPLPLRSALAAKGGYPARLGR